MKNISNFSVLTILLLETLTN